MSSMRFDHHPRFAELSDWLHELATDYPHLIELNELGRSYEDRALWIATVTDASTGPHDTKPALWLDGNIHASETTASVALLHLLGYLCTNHGGIDDVGRGVTRALATRTFYIVPRVNPDGAELALGELPFIVRANTRPWPVAEQQDGLIASDIDHDGRILQMRVEDPNGTWKPYPNDHRLLVARSPIEDDDGPYYRLLREGRIQGYDGDDMSAANPLAGIDSNRNFPYEWKRYPGGSPSGAGDFPTSEPEVRAVVQGVVDRPNITGYMSYHTFSGVHLRPFGDRPDDAYPSFDLWVYETLGEHSTAITGYPAVSEYHGFRYDPKFVITGVANDWAYEHLGVIAWTTEFWNPLVAAGIEDPHPVEWYRKHSLDDELALLAWVDDNVPEGYVDWYPFEHPELGHVELGGWNTADVFRNPPAHLLEAEVAPHSELAVFQALTSPLLRLREQHLERLGDDTWRVRVVVENSGWLPTNVTARALDQNVVQPVSAAISGPLQVVGGSNRIELGQLEGRALRTSSIGMFSYLNDGSNDRAAAEWTIRAAPGGEVEVRIAHPRAGVVTATFRLTGEGESSPSSLDP